MSIPTTPIDYTNLGYAALREAMLARARTSLPEWTDFSESDLGVLMVDLVAYAADITLYYQTRLAANLMPATADEPDAVVQLLRLIGYELQPPAPATAHLRIAVNATETMPLTVPSGTQFFVTLAAGEQLTFETVRPLTLQTSQFSTPPDERNLRYFYPLTVVEGETVTAELVGTADGMPNQQVTLARAPVIAGSLALIVIEPGNLTTRWQEQETLAHSTPVDRHYIVQRDPTGAATVIFGDGINGMIPPAGSVTTPVQILATYRVGGGSKGNVPANRQFRSGLAALREALNPQRAAGGTDGEALGRAQAFAPRLYRTQDRAVTADDYTTMARQVPGVGKARALALNWNDVLLYIAPAGQVTEPSELLKRDLLAFFENRRMVTTNLVIVGPQPADIYLRATVQAEPYFLQDEVRLAVEAVVATYLAFDNVDFAQPIYLSKLYDLIQSLPQITSLLITEFSRTPYSNTVDSDGVIDVAAHEVPRAGYRDNAATPANSGQSAPQPPIVVTIQGGVTQGGVST
jgi:hypothetical protein